MHSRNTALTTLAFSMETATRRRQRLEEIREAARSLFESGAPGIQTATFISQMMDNMILEIWNETLQALPSELIARLEKSSAIVAVGGTGRGELSPYSDIDLLFLYSPTVESSFRECYTQFEQACWDAKLEPGISCRTLTQCLSDCKSDPKFQTSLVESRMIWGARPLTDKLIREYRKQVIHRRLGTFIDDCVRTRESEWKDGRAVQELEPDIKTSSGGLRDLHLIRWVGYAVYGTADFDSLRLQGALEKDEAQVLKHAWEYLTRLRNELHFNSGSAEEKLSRGEQLRIAAARGYADQEGQRGVERLMTEYFRHTMQIASITRRFVARNRPQSLHSQFKEFMVSHRAEHYLRVGETVECSPRHVAKVTKDLDSVLQVYRLCASLGLLPGVTLDAGLRKAAPQFQKGQLPATEAATFMEILRYGQALPAILRHMADTEILDVVLPEFTRIRGLMQFNPYHHFTVDEHTLRAVEFSTNYPADSGPLVQQVYRELQNKNLLHLALLLHDIGKGFVEDHCLVGERIALEVAQRLHLPPSQGELLAFLIRWHLEMADIAFRRDHTDPDEIVPFAHKCGTPERLQMLYALTVADVTAVGPGTWSHWKAIQLGEFYDRCFVVLSGRHFGEYEAARLRKMTAGVSSLLAESAPEIPNAWIEKQMSGLSAYYFTCTEADRVAADLRILYRLNTDEVIVDSEYEPQTATIEYRIFTRNPDVVSGCFHRMAGTLTALRMGILSAEINTTREGAIIDRFHVRDRDFSGEPPQYRRDAVATALRDVLFRKTKVPDLYKKNKKFGSRQPPPAGNELPTRVVIDSESSETRTIIDVFAYDRAGLLYSVSRVLFELNLSVDLAKISTHFNQVLDVFYVREQDGTKVSSEARLKEIQVMLETRLQEFETHGWQQFA